MSDDDRRLTFDIEDGDSFLAEHIAIAHAAEYMDALAPTHLRPVHAMVVESHAWSQQPGHVHKYLVNWEHLAVLQGQIRAAHEALPVHLRDQWRSMEREAYEASVPFANGPRS